MYAAPTKAKWGIIDLSRKPFELHFSYLLRFAVKTNTASKMKMKKPLLYDVVTNVVAM